MVKSGNQIVDDKRKKSGIVTSVVGLFFNIVLAIAKIVVGTIFHSIAILADGLNNATDFLASIVSIFSFKFASKPADNKHPFGHQRLEYVATLIIAFIIFFVAFELIKSSIDKIVSGGALEVSIIMFVILGVSIVVKMAMGVYFKIMAKKLNSSTLKASAFDSFSDVGASGAVLVSSLIMQFSGLNLDGYFGVLVAIFVLFTGIKILKDVINPLLGEPPSEKLVEQIRNEIKSYDGVLGLHELLIHSYGPNKRFASVHVEVDGDMDTNASHELADKIERDLKAKSINLVVHIDPHGVSDFKKSTQSETTKSEPKQSEKPQN